MEKTSGLLGGETKEGVDNQSPRLSSWQAVGGVVLTGRSEVFVRLDDQLRCVLRTGRMLAEL